MCAGAVKALQVESNICITGGADGTLRIWDLDLAESIFHQSPPPLLSPSNVEAITNSFENVLLGKAHPEDVFGIGAGPTVANGSSRDDGVMREAAGRKEERSPCVKTLDGHTKAVTSLYFDGNCLVRPPPPPSASLTFALGHGLLGPDTPTMGSRNGSMRAHDGHSLGHLKPPRLANALLRSPDRHLRRSR